MEFRVTHVYGLTETCGPSVACEWKAEWDGEPPEQRARLKSRQGVRAPLLDGLMVADPDTLQPVPKDGQAIGEIMMRDNVVMKGYLKNPSATAEAFAGGWLHSGDLAVWSSPPCRKPPPAKCRNSSCANRRGRWPRATRWPSVCYAGWARRLALSAAKPNKRPSKEAQRSAAKAV